jgi:TfoX/Sxy family transcriptional regulator of competence genes
MASDPSFVQFVVDQFEDDREITYRKMFGEYALYSKGKVVALICDNQLFVKPTTSGRSFIGDVIEAPAYKGAKPSFLIEDQIEDRDWINRLIELTEQELPKAKPRKKKDNPKKSYNKRFNPTFPRR